MIVLKKPPLEHETLICEDRMITVSRSVKAEKAGSALRSFILLCEQRDTTSFSFSAEEIVRANNLFGNCTPLPSAKIAFHNGNTVLMLNIFDDRSALIWTSKDKKTFSPLPLVFKLKNSVQPMGHEKGSLELLKTNKTSLVLAFTKGRRSYDVTLDTKRQPFSVQAIYVQTLMETIAWAQQVSAITTVPTHNNPIGAMNVETFLDKDQLAALNEHLTYAATIINTKLSPKISGWSYAVFARGIGQNGKPTEPEIKVQALNKNQRRDKDLEKRISRAFLTALKHPSCPVPFDSIISQYTIWASKGKTVSKTHTELMRAILHHDVQQEIKALSGHDLMSAYAHFGSPTALFP